MECFHFPELNLLVRGGERGDFSVHLYNLKPHLLRHGAARSFDGRKNFSWPDLRSGSASIAGAQADAGDISPARGGRMEMPSEIGCHKSFGNRARRWAVKLVIKARFASIMKAEWTKRVSSTRENRAGLDAVFASRQSDSNP